MQFIINVFVARIISKDNYGLINYSSSLIAFFTAMFALGFDGIVTKKFAEDRANKGLYLGTALVSRTVFAIVCIIFLQIVVRVISPGDTLLYKVTFIQSLTILFGASDLLVFWYRFINEAKIVAVTNFTAFFIAFIFKVIALAVFKNLYLYLIAVSAEVFLSMLIMSVYYFKHNRDKFGFSWKIFKKMISISYPFIISGILSAIYWQTDKLMIKSFMDNAAVANYSVAMTMAGTISIASTAIIEGFRPDIMNFKQTNENLYKKRFRQLYGLVFWICVVYCIFVTIFAKFLVLLIFGVKYLDAVPALYVVVWYVMFSYFSYINNLYMVAENKIKWIQIITFIGSVINIILNFILIPKFGIVGAALASLITQVLANFILVSIIPSLRGCFRLICDGITLKDINVKVKFKIKKAEEKKYDNI